jgi:PKD repeat protein
VLRVRFQVEGASPSTLRIKVWRDGTAEPAAWQLERTDSTAALQVASGVGVGNYVASSASNTPIVATWDDFRATTIGGDVPPPANVEPVASFTSQVSGLSVSVDAAGSSDSDGTVASYVWDFGDGSAPVSGAQASRVYAEAGTYTVRLTVTDDDGATATTTRSVTVTAPPAGNVEPVASFTSQVSGLSVSLDAAGSSDSDGTVASYAWDFGDGSAVGSGRQTSYVYGQAGTYTVRLTVTDDDGATGTTTASVTVAGAPPVADVLAADAFSRTAASGWGTADTGGAWSHSGASFAVDGASGRATLGAPGSGPRSRLGSVSAGDVDVSASLAFDKRPSAGTLYGWLSARSVSSSTDYVGRVLVNSAGATTVQLMRRVSFAETSLGSVSVPGLSYTPGTVLRVRFQVEGASPSTLRIKVWRDGTAEPAAWQLERTDSTAALQVASGVGVGNYVASSASNTPIVATWDDFRATTLDG